jgi:hypothetical protein
MSPGNLACSTVTNRLHHWPVVQRCRPLAPPSASTLSPRLADPLAWPWPSPPGGQRRPGCPHSLRHATVTAALCRCQFLPPVTCQISPAMRPRTYPAGLLGAGLECEKPADIELLSGPDGERSARNLHRWTLSGHDITTTRLISPPSTVCHGSRRPGSARPPQFSGRPQ